jgi:hypothetical protein
MDTDGGRGVRSLLGGAESTTETRGTEISPMRAKVLWRLMTIALTLVLPGCLVVTCGP